MVNDNHEVAVTKIPNPGGPQKAEDHRQDDRHEETLQDAKDGPLEASGVDDFLQRLPGSFRWPKPNAEAIAAAVEAVHRMSGSAALDLAAAAEPDQSADACSACGSALPPGAVADDPGARPRGVEVSESATGAPEAARPESAGAAGTN